MDVIGVSQGHEEIKRKGQLVGCDRALAAG